LERSDEPAVGVDPGGASGAGFGSLAAAVDADGGPLGVAGDLDVGNGNALLVEGVEGLEVVEIGGGVDGEARVDHDSILSLWIPAECIFVVMEAREAE
jgi:hypothetical protein